MKDVQFINGEICVCCGISLLAYFRHIEHPS